MSRRTRLRNSKQASQIGLNHHPQYSSSVTCFPESYSIFGTPISMPAKLLPLEHDNKINYVLHQKQLLTQQCPLLKLSQQTFRNAKLANITLSGTITQHSSRAVTHCLFVFSMAFCCLMSIFSNWVFRRKFYTRYEIEIEEYQKLGQIIRKLKNCQNLIINIQDNKLTEQKMDILQNSITDAMMCQSLEIDYDLTKCRKIVTIRNYCYFMKDLSLKNIISKLSKNDYIDSAFVWQENVIQSSSSPRERGEYENLLGPILPC